MTHRPSHSVPRGAAVAMTTGDAWGRPANDGGGAPGEQQGRTDGERTGDRHEARKHSENTARGRKPALKNPVNTIRTKTQLGAERPSGRIYLAQRVISHCESVKHAALWTLVVRAH